MAYDQQHHLRLVGYDGFRLIEELYGPAGRRVDNSLQHNQRPAIPKPPKPPQPGTVFQKPVFISTSGTYVNDAPRVPPPKEAGNPRNNLLQPTQGHGGPKPNSYQVPPAPRRKGDVINSDQAAKTYGGYLF